MAAVLCCMGHANLGGESISAEREESIRYVDDDKGRLDIVISAGDQWLCVVEVKTRNYTQDDLDKQAKYLKAFKDKDAEPVFLAVSEDEEMDLHNFRFLGWRDVCLTLRTIAPDLLQRKGPLVCAVMLGFVAAVEQNLLRLSSKSSTIPTVQYLDEFLGRIQ